MARLTDEAKAELKLAFRDISTANRLTNVSDIPVNFDDYIARCDLASQCLQRAKSIMEKYK